jgi:hypothetical protein
VAVHGQAWHRPLQIALTQETLTIPWESRQALLSKLRRVEPLTGVVEAFEAVGVSRPVKLSFEHKMAMSEAIRVWAEELGFDALPEGIAALRVALVDEGS